ncbi:glycoside hydrolase domain-containing protein [Pedobacter sp. UC225_65]|uniref:glycoside hydrolase domain-containing protein n=1 Tax=Pedobacter sp. UC225_65 TaxID=3350173 RepID=UPI00366B0AC9
MKSLCLTVLLLSLFVTSNQAQEIKFTTAKNSWNADSLGNQRVLVNFVGTGKIAKATIAWRRSQSKSRRKDDHCTRCQNRSKNQSHLTFIHHQRKWPDLF